MEMKKELEMKEELEAERRIPSREEFKKVMDERFSPEIHARLSSGRIGIAGLGGLGSNIAVMLARSGIGCLHLVDFDYVDLSNLNRQAYRVEHLGRAKTEALKGELMQINPYLEIKTDMVKITAENAVDIFSEDQIVCEAFDVPENKAMLVNALLGHRPDVAVIAGSGMAGYGSGNSIQTRRICKNLYLCGDGITDAGEGTGLMSGRVSICAGHQANMAVRLLLGENEI